MRRGDELGVVDGELEGDPAAHGPAGDVGGGDVEGLEEVDDGLLLQ